MPELKSPDPESFLKLLWPLVAEHFLPGLAQSKATEPAQDDFVGDAAAAAAASWSPSLEGLAGVASEPTVAGPRQRVAAGIRLGQRNGPPCGNPRSPRDRAPGDAQVWRTRLLLTRRQSTIPARAGGTGCAGNPSHHGGATRGNGDHEPAGGRTGPMAAGRAGHTPGSGVRTRAVGTRWIDPSSTASSIALSWTRTARAGSSTSRPACTAAQVLKTSWTAKPNATGRSCVAMRTLMRAFRPGEPVKAALYFPLLKAWKEVDVATGE